MLLRRVLALALALAASALFGQTVEQTRSQPVSRRALEKSPALIPPKRGVVRGEHVMVEVTSGAARLTFEATAESTGRMGDSVLVRNPANGRLFQAKVFDSGKVFVQK
jgi:flagella basal body P-ring formation protein FlgA